MTWHIGISSLDVYNHLRHTFGSLILPSHISNWQTNTPTESNMPFWSRLVNFYEVWRQMYSWVNEHTPVEDAIAKEYLGQDLPHIDDITRNMSIYLVNKHLAFLQGRPEQPNVIFYHGFHISKVPDAPPKVYIYIYIPIHIIYICIYIIFLISSNEIQ